MSETASKLQVRSRIWVEIDGEPVFGQGREELLRLIQKGNSINAAAKAMGIPYRKAWTYIDAMGKRLGFPLETEKVSVFRELNRVTPEDHIAPWDIPVADNSAMGEPLQCP